MTPLLLGTSFIGHARSSGGEICGNGIQPGTGAILEPPYISATPEEVERAMELAASAFPIYSAMSGKTRADFLRTIAEEMEAVEEEIIPRGQLETALPEDRLRSEFRRTTGHLFMFANLIEDGSWVDARIDRADLSREPLPKPDIRSMLQPLGTVAVFCAANFPLAYSVAGGDSVAALAAGCPVVVIAHESHPGVSEMVAGAVVRAAQRQEVPEGVFSLLYGGGRKVGQSVVKHPVTQAVGFTGSRAGGLALMEIAAKRPQPIPVYAEMSSINPVVILPGALAQGEETLATEFFGSLALGVGQFCTNPGLVFLVEGTGDTFLKTLGDLVRTAEPGTMLNSGIAGAFVKSTAATSATEGVETLARSGTHARKDQAAPVVFTVSTRTFLENPSLQREMFGPATLMVRGPLDDIELAVSNLEGQLTATLHPTPEELTGNPRLVFALRTRAGRFIHNGFPTGVEVGDSTVHGGPYPATSDGRSTSVGTMSIFRFCRPVAWQDFPDEALPPELQADNPLGIRRTEHP